jgi:hypothetical protein
MGFLDSLTSTRRPERGTPVLSKQDVLVRLRALSRPTAPYRINGMAEQVDLIAERKIVDAAWYALFEKAGLSKVFCIYLKLDEKKHEVRAMDRGYTVSWSAGAPTLSVVATAFKGQMQSIAFGKGYAFTEQLEVGEVPNYRFDTREIKMPIQDAVTGSGWTYKGVAFGTL